MPSLSNSLSGGTRSAADLIDLASGAIRSLVGWHVAPVQEDTVTIRANGSRRLLLPTLRLVEIDSITVGGETIPSDAYEAYPDGVVICPPWSGRVVVTMHHGFDAVPADLSETVAAIVARAGLPANATGMTSGPFSVQLRMPSGFSGGATVTAAEMVVLDKYRLGPRP